MKTQSSLLTFLRNMTGAHTDSSDGHLLDRFLEGDCEEAFALLVRRHGPMVFGVCQRILSENADAEDAFQATFVVLAKRASSIRKRDSLASWLYGVALRCSRQLKVTRMNQREKERAAGQQQQNQTVVHSQVTDLEVVLDEEIRRLPRKYQEPILLCYFEGLTREEAAQQLGWPIGTIAGRLSRANQMLKKRLVKRGVATATVAVPAILEQQAGQAALSSQLLRSTIYAIRAITTGVPEATVLSGNAVNVSRQVLQQMVLTKWKKSLIGLLILACVVGGAVTGYAMQSTTQPQPVAEASPQTQIPQAEDPKKPAYYRLKNKDQSIVVLSDKKMDLTRYFQTHRILVGAWPDREADVYLKTNAEEATVGCHYGTINDNLDDQWYVVNAKMAKIKEPVRKMCLDELNRLIKKKNRPHWGLVVILRQDADNRKLYHLVGYSKDSSVRFFADKHRNLQFKGPGKTNPFAK